MGGFGARTEEPVRYDRSELVTGTYYRARQIVRQVYRTFPDLSIKSYVTGDKNDDKAIGYLGRKSIEPELRILSK